MKFSRIKAIIVEHLLLLVHYLGLLIDTFYWPVMDIIIWGFMTIYLGRLGEKTEIVVSFFMSALILWTIAWRSQQDITVSFLFDVWNQNMTNLFTTPLTPTEFIIAVIILGVIKISMTLLAMTAIAYLFYNYQIWLLGFAFLPFFVNLLFFGWWVGIFVTALILYFGKQIQTLGWGFIVLLSPLSCVYYPLSSLPLILQKIALFLPTTHVFEGMRSVLVGADFSIEHILWAFGLNIIYLILSGLFFRFMFEKAREKGRLVKLEE